MTKKTLLLLALPFFLQADNFYVEYKPCGFSFEEQVLRDIFSDFTFSSQLEVGYVSDCYWGVSLNGQYIGNSGRGINSEFRATVDMYTLALVAKGYYPISECYIPYVGIGPRYFFFKNYNESPFVQKNIRKGGVGGMITVGMQMLFDCWGLFIDPFVDYGFLKMDFPRNPAVSENYDIQVGGFTVGVGIGVRF